METLIADERKFAPHIIDKARDALESGHRRPINYAQPQWLQINVGRRYRLLLKGDGKAILMTHETANRFCHKRT